jgi:hypothetical protein
MANKEMEYMRRRILELEARLVMVEEALQGRYARAFYTSEYITYPLKYRLRQIATSGAG